MAAGDRRTADPGDRASHPRQRPKDRKSQILATAAALFAELGFHNVTMGQIAEPVGITPGALYRHFSSKSVLLEAVLLDYAERIGVTPADDQSLENLVRARSVVASRMLHMGVLWSREFRSVSRTAREPLVRIFQDTNTAYAQAIRRERPELSPPTASLAAWAMMSILSSTSDEIRGLSRDDYADLLTAACMAAARAPLEPADEVQHLPASSRHPVSKRENLLAVASHLFGERGFQATSLADIGMGADVTGPAIYSHFTNKADVLDAVLERADHALWLVLLEALRTTADPAEALDRLADGYVDLVVAHPHLIALRVAESEILPETWRERQREYQQEWVALLLDTRQELDEPRAQALVRAATTMVQHLNRTQNLALRTHFGRNVRNLMTAVLAADPTSP